MINKNKVDIIKEDDNKNINEEKEEKNSEKIENKNEYCDFITNLNKQNLGNIARTIFLFLDSKTLHLSRQVCHSWNKCIKTEVWDTKEGRNILEKRLERNWMNNKLLIKEFKIDSYIDMIVSDETFLVCLMNDATASMYHLSSGEHILNFNTKLEEEDFLMVPGQDKIIWQDLAIGPKIVVAVDGRFLKSRIRIWSKNTGNILYKHNKHRENSQIIIRIKKNTVLTANFKHFDYTYEEDTDPDEDENNDNVHTEEESSIVTIYNYENENINKKYEFIDDMTITDLDIDGNYILITSMHDSIMKLWKIINLYNNSTITKEFLKKIDSNSVESVIMNHPYAITINGWDGVRIWNLEKNMMLRRVGAFTRFKKIITNGTFLLASLYIREKHCCNLFKIKDLISEAQEEKDIWKRELCNTFCSSITKTKIVGHNKETGKVYISNF